MPPPKKKTPRIRGNKVRHHFLHTVGIRRLLIGGKETAFRQFISDIFAATETLLDTRRKISRGMGFTTSQFAILIAVSQLEGPPSIRRLADHLRISASNVTADVNRLAQRGLLSKAASLTDVRALEVRFTSKGRGVLRELLPIARKTNDLLFAHMTANEMNVITKVCSEVALAGDAATANIAIWSANARRSP